MSQTTTEAAAIAAVPVAEEVPAAPDRVTSRAALATIIAPVAVRLRVGTALAVVAGVLGVVPYVALVLLGDVLISAANAGVAPDAAEVGRILMLLLGSFLGRLLVYVVALMVTHVADVALNRSVRGRMIAAIGRAPLSWFSDRTSGMVRKTLQEDVTNLHVLVAHKPVDQTIAIVMPLALAAYAFVLDWRLGVLAVLAPLVYSAAYAVMMRGMGDKMLQLDARFERLSGTIVEFIDGISVVKAFGIVGKAHDRYARQADEANDFYYAWVKPMLRTSSLTMAIVAAPTVMLVTFGGGALMVGRGWVSPAEVVVVSLISLMIPHAIETLGNQAWGRQLAEAAAVRIARLLDCDQLVAPAHSLELPADASVRFDGVSFSYGETAALRDVTLELPAGSVTALIGPSGSGKTTLATLVARFGDPDTGTVSIGGVDVRSLSEADLYRHVGFVLQDPQLLIASVADNIRLARPEATDAEVHAAASAAQVHDEILALPHGYDTVIGSETGLSGGQRQRIAIARAILADRPVLLLDEATAMTDPDCEAAIQQALSELVTRKTVLVIAHRPASVLGADQIVVLDAGRVVARGTHEDLVDHPVYQSIWRQAGGHDTAEEQ
jgi:ATP-binding cassette subfamily B protein